ncbi:Cytochrome P450 [Arabidopsis suecica]|uniref:Cytochrome P450 n=1 Tax=Arabidopsis suecica TaxID=45249 RepID=A0A8T2CPF7_ARASU|nr:Cytochrome P450 [Arabidopsis suecica]
MAILIYLSWVLLLTLFSIIFLKKKNHNSNLRLPPGPRGLPIIGNLHRVTGLPHRWFHQLSSKYGPVMLIRLGFTPVVVISSSEAAEEVLKTKDLETCSRTKLMATGKLSYNFKDITFAPYNDSWREYRKVAVMELLNPKKLQTLKFIREEEMDFVVKKISNSALEQSPVAVDLSKISFSLAANILCRTALGQNLRTNKFFDEERIIKLVEEGSVASGRLGFNDFFPGKLAKFADWLFQRKKGILERMFKELDEFYQHVIDDHLKSLDGPKSTDPPADIVAGLLNMVDKNGTCSTRNVNHVKGTLMDFSLGGIDTVAIIIVWAMAELSRNPRVMKKVQEEIRAVLGSKREKITEEDVDKVEYLKHVIKETFRLHPAVPSIPRESMSHQIKIQGYDIPPNTRIQINTWAIGRDPKIWKNPEEFIPERFTDSAIHYKGQNYELLPFGSGRRICPAMPMASNIVELGLLNMLYFFDWKLPDGMVAEDIDMEDAGMISFYKKAPLILVPVKHH